ncbi:MAG TPA: lamin tail domain-containing protein, partial [Rhodothermales bacterium]|nr:lamin tail domain-containing protein [Rhodothermales bacterium]
DGDNTTHANVIAGVDYDDGSPWPSDNGNGSIYLTDLSTNPNDGANWALSSDGAVTPTFDAYTSEAAGGNSGSDIGSPGPGPVLVTLLINEIHADPDGSLAGDANGDGTRDSSDDEFVEIVNTTTSDIDLSGWTISDGVGVRHTFATGSVVTAECAMVVFGGGSPSGGFGQATVQTASTNALGFNNGGDTVTLSDAASNVVATYTYGGEGGDNQSLTRDPDITGGEPLVKHSTATGSGGALFSPGTQIDGTNFSGCADDPPPSIAEIYEIQGSGATSPFAGQTVTTEDNVVTATAPNGFFMQTPTARSDNDSDTSDGIFVFTGNAPGVVVGDLVDVTGEVVEFFDFTEFSNGPTVTVDGTSSLPPPVVFDSTTPSPDPTSPSCAIEFECYEGMLIQITGGAVGGPNQFFGSDPIAEVHIVADGTRPFREPGIEYPGMSGLPVWDGNPEVFELDPDKLGLPNQIIPAGSSFDAVGVLGYEFGGYELWPSSLTVTPAVIPEPVRAVAAGESTVGSLNLFRLFDDVDDPADSNGRNDDVVSAAEYQRRLDKFSLYIRTVLGSPDILAVQEAEKLGVLQDLAAEIQADDPTITYAAYLIEGNDIGTIDVGFLVRTDRVQVDAVTQLGASETFVDPTDNSVDILHDRPPLLLEGAFTGVSSQPQPIAVMVLHMRSLSGIETSARVQRKRLEQAQSVAQMVQDFQTANPDIGLVVTGDFNAFEFTDGYVHLVGRVQGDFDDAEDLETGPDLVNPNLTNQVLGLTPLERYSFVFNGTAQVLDHALTTTALDGAVTGYEYGRGNADAAEILLDDPATPLRASDHDGLVLFLDVAPPEITVVEEPITLDPPNHSYRTISVADFVTGVTEATLTDIYIVSVTSDEEENGNGDGNTIDDIVIADCQSVDLRAERQGGGNGRVYTITVAASDVAGNVGTASFEVWVPKDKKKPALNDGGAYTVESGCSAPAANASVAKAAGDTPEAMMLEEMPSEYVLGANYPNPFNPATTIEFALPEAATVRLTVYDVTGREVARLVEGSVSAGQHRVLFDARSLPSGVYFYRLTAPGFTQTQRMVLMK